MLLNFTKYFDKIDLYIVIFALLLTYLIRVRAGKDPLSWDHFWQNLDKFLVTFMFGFVFITAVRQSGQIWIQDLVKQLLPAVLALLGARAFTARAGDNTNNGVTTSKTTTSSTVTSLSPAVDTELTTEGTKPSKQTTDASQPSTTQGITSSEVAVDVKSDPPVVT